MWNPKHEAYKELGYAFACTAIGALIGAAMLLGATGGVH